MDEFGETPANVDEGLPSLRLGARRQPSPASSPVSSARGGAAGRLLGLAATVGVGVGARGAGAGSEGEGGGEGEGEGEGEGVGPTPQPGNSRAQIHLEMAGGEVWGEEKEWGERGMDLSVTSSEIVLNAFTVYVVEVCWRGERWKVKRRYRHFHSLHKQLQRTFPDQDLPLFPPKLMSPSTSPAVVEARTRSLNKYLQCLCRLELVCRSELVGDFLAPEFDGTDWSPRPAVSRADPLEPAPNSDRDDNLFDVPVGEEEARESQHARTHRSRNRPSSASLPSPPPEAVASAREKERPHERHDDDAAAARHALRKSVKVDEVVDWLSSAWQSGSGKSFPNPSAPRRSSSSPSLGPSHPPTSPPRNAAAVGAASAAVASARVSPVRHGLRTQSDKPDTGMLSWFASKLSRRDQKDTPAASPAPHAANSPGPQDQGAKGEQGGMGEGLGEGARGRRSGWLEEEPRHPGHNKGHGKPARRKPGPREEGGGSGVDPEGRHKDKGEGRRHEDKVPERGREKEDAMGQGDKPKERGKQKRSKQGNNHRGQGEKAGAKGDVKGASGSAKAREEVKAENEDQAERQRENQEIMRCAAERKRARKAKKEARSQQQQQPQPQQPPQQQGDPEPALFKLEGTSWTQHRAEDGREYFHNSESHVSTWAKADVIASEWVEYPNATPGHPPYYHNRVTGQTTWEAPEGIDLEQARLRGRQQLKVRDLRQRDRDEQYRTEERVHYERAHKQRVDDWAADKRELWELIAHLPAVVDVPPQALSQLRLSAASSQTDTRKAYRRAMLLLHPDKQSSALPAHEVALRSLVFDVMTQRYAKFCESLA